MNTPPRRQSHAVMGDTKAGARLAGFSGPHSEFQFKADSVSRRLITAPSPVRKLLPEPPGRHIFGNRRLHADPDLAKQEGRSYTQQGQ